MISNTFVDEVLNRLAVGQRVQRALGEGGRLYLDRRLPFLCVYRLRGEPSEAPTAQLISTQSAYLILPPGKAVRRTTSELLVKLIASEMEHFGGFLVIELWASPGQAYQPRLHEESGETLAPAPWFGIHVDPRREPSQAVVALAQSLRKLRILKQRPKVEACPNARCGPSGEGALLPSKEIKRLGCFVIGLEVMPVHRDPETGDVFPSVARTLRRSLGRALNQTFFAFARSYTTIRPRHYHTLGRRSFAKVVWEADRQLAALESTFDLLLQATPTNAEGAWLDFRRRRFETAPVFHYRPVTVEPSELKRQLFQVPIDKIEDATLAHLLREKQDELDRKITMLGDVGTRKFLPGSLQVYGAVDDKLASLASELLQRIPARAQGNGQKHPLGAEAFAQRAREEIRHYRFEAPRFQPVVEVRDDIYSGLLVSDGRLLIGRKTKIPSNRSDALLQHEVGTHLLTHFNGGAQPFRQLAVGLAGYDGFQEGLAVLAEYLAGGLNRARLRLLAGRVQAVKSILDGAGFVDTFRLVNLRLGFPKRTAYTITMRVHRAGGLTKDASYLRGLVEILEYLGDGGRLESLFIGKIAADHIPLIEELRLRQIVHAPPLQPRYLQFAQYPENMARIRAGLTVLDLLRGSKKTPDRRSSRPHEENKA